MNISMFSAGMVPPLHYGGTERIVYWLCRELISLGHRIYFFGPQGSIVPGADKMFYFRLSDRNINTNPVDFRESIPVDTDIVHIHAATDLKYSYPLLKTVHGYPFHKGGFNFAESEQFDEDYSFVSNAHRNACKRPENPFVYNGVDLDEYTYSESKDDYFLFLGKVDWGTKGLIFAIKIAMELKLKLVIAGDFLKPEFYEKTLKGLLNEHIIYVGPVGGKEKAELLSGARALLFPVIWPEPFGLVVTEALASGTPVLTTCEGAMPEIMIDGVTGFLCKNVGEMKENVKKLDQIDPAECREHVARNFTSRHMALNYLKLYEEKIRNYDRQYSGIALSG